MINYVVYGSTMIDKIRLTSGEVISELLGGGGPQGAFGARVWDRSVGILTRSGTDLPDKSRKTLESLGVDLTGWKQYSGHQTPMAFMSYDENQRMLTGIEIKQLMRKTHSTMHELISEKLPIPEIYYAPRVIHLITGDPDETIAHEALNMKANGSIYSLEPIMGYRGWDNISQIVSYLSNVDLVVPDWLSASRVAGSEDPLNVLRYWSQTGVQAVAIRNGVQGSYVWDRETDHMWHIPIVTVETIDPTGCGNSYAGGFCVGWDQHRDSRIAGCYGTISASFLAKIVGVEGVTPQIEREAHRLLDRHLNKVKSM